MIFESNPFLGILLGTGLNTGAQQQVKLVNFFASSGDTVIKILPLVSLTIEVNNWVFEQDSYLIFLTNLTIDESSGSLDTM